MIFFFHVISADVNTFVKFAQVLHNDFSKFCKKSGVKWYLHILSRPYFAVHPNSLVASDVSEYVDARSPALLGSNL